MGTGSFILAHYLGLFCCLSVVGGLAAVMALIGRRKFDPIRSRNLEIRQTPENAQEPDPSSEIDQPDDSR